MISDNHAGHLWQHRHDRHHVSMSCMEAVMISNNHAAHLWQHRATATMCFIIKTRKTP